MKTDTYTKVVLTVIALCLIYICALQSDAALFAQPTQSVLSALPAQPVVVVGYGHLDPRAPGGVAIAWIDERKGIGDEIVPVRPIDDPQARPLRVAVESAPQLSVSLDEVRKGATWDPVRTEVEKQPPSAKPGGGQR